MLTWRILTALSRRRQLVIHMANVVHHTAIAARNVKLEPNEVVAIGSLESIVSKFGHYYTLVLRFPPSISPEKMLVAAQDCDEYMNDMYFNVTRISNANQFALAYTLPAKLNEDVASIADLYDSIHPVCQHNHVCWKALGLTERIHNVDALENIVGRLIGGGFVEFGVRMSNLEDMLLTIV